MEHVIAYQVHHNMDLACDYITDLARDLICFDVVFY